jgi:hypothetical protein
MIGKTNSHLPREIIRNFNFVGIDLSNISQGESQHIKIIGKR